MDGIVIGFTEPLKHHLLYLLMVLVSIFAQDVGSTHLTKETRRPAGDHKLHLWGTLSSFPTFAALGLLSRSSVPTPGC